MKIDRTTVFLFYSYSLFDVFRQITVYRSNLVFSLRRVVEQ